MASPSPSPSPSPTTTIISECWVKPLEESDAHQPINLTPPELRLLNLNYTQKGLLFQKPPPPHFSITSSLDHLRRSLSATLTHFYPLAARLATREQPSYLIYIDPKNSPGAKFIYATVDVTVSDIITSTYVPSVVHSFFDLSDATNHDGHTLPLLSIQVTELKDGIFIGWSVNHLVADGTSLWHLMASWSEIFRSKTYHSISRPPIFDRWSLRGHDPVINLPYTHHTQFIEPFQHRPQFKERFFHFSSASISRLKAKANTECDTDKISSLQAVSALLWRCVTRARQKPRHSETICKLTINIRPRLNPPLSDDYFGSPVQSESREASVEDLMGHSLGWAALQLHEAVKNHDDAAVKKRVESWLKNPVILKRGDMCHPNAIIFTSSPKFDMYGCEFGLGKAVASRSGVTNKADGKMTMYPGRDGGGSMDVEVCLLPEYMTAFEDDQELINALK